MSDESAHRAQREPVSEATKRANNRILAVCSVVVASIAGYEIAAQQLGVPNGPLLGEPVGVQLTAGALMLAYMVVMFSGTHVVNWVFDQ